MEKLHEQLQNLLQVELSMDTVEEMYGELSISINDALTEAQIADIIKWNTDRGCCSEVSYRLERTMLTSEIREAYASTTVVDLIDAIADIIFVEVGTWAKATAQERITHNGGVRTRHLSRVNDYYPIIDYARSELVYRAYSDYMQDAGIAYDITVSIIRDAITIVIEANNLKPKERDSNGKIIKGDKWVAPEPKLREMLIKYGIDVDTPLAWDYRWLQ